MKSRRLTPGIGEVEAALFMASSFAHAAPRATGYSARGRRRQLGGWQLKTKKRRGLLAAPCDSERRPRGVNVT
jgi:hypothetical protein